MSARMYKEMFAAILITVGLCASPAGGQTPSRVTTATQTAPDLSSSLEAAARQVGPSVVEIFTTSYKPGSGMVPSLGDLLAPEHASGSGVIMDRDGYIVTNAHVVQGARSLRVDIPIAPAGQSILATRTRTLSGQVVGLDSETDLAVVKVDEKNLPALAFADSDELRQGQLVLAFGSPLGLHNSVSLGVISGIARQLVPESPMIYLQTDAAINPGSSGGPLVDLHGRVVGINTLIISQAGGNEGIGFAAPSNIVKSVFEQIKKSGRVHRGEIGIRPQTITKVLASGLNLARDHGVILADVTPNSPAAQAGLLPGDLVLSLNGKPMENGRQLQIGLYRRALGDVVSLEILRDGRTSTVPVAINERKDYLAGLSAPVDPNDNLVPRLGILGVNLDQRIAEALPVSRVRFGIVVASTVAGAIDARSGGLDAGDVISAVNRTTVRDLTELRAALDALKTGDPVVLQLERHGELMYLAFTAE